MGQGLQQYAASIQFNIQQLAHAWLSGTGCVFVFSAHPPVPVPLGQAPCSLIVHPAGSQELPFPLPPPHSCQLPLPTPRKLHPCHAMPCRLPPLLGSAQLIPLSSAACRAARP